MKYTSTCLGVLALLLCGSVAAGTGFTYVTQTYAGDAANNVAVDGKTGLQWRRCSEGQAWDGTTCTGSAIAYTHEQALALAKGKAGWRLPTVKELASLADRSRINPSIDPAAFPATSSTYFWSASPGADIGSGAWFVYFRDGNVGDGGRFNTLQVRLVRASQ